MYKDCIRVLLLISILPLHSAIDSGHLPIRPNQCILDYIELGNHYGVQFLKTSTGDRYLVKQKNNKFSDTNKALQAVREIVGAYFAHQVGIPSQQVWIIPSSLQFPGKLYENKCATLHKVVPGTLIKRSKWKALDIRQKDQPGLGYVRGLSLSIIKQMAVHKHLPAIVALDTFCGNGGRHNDNFFYELSKDLFWIIDMGGAFKKNYVSESIKNISSLMRQHIKLSPKERQALASYRDTLQRLYDIYNPVKIEEMMDAFVTQCDVDFYIGQHVKTSVLVHLQESYNDVPEYLQLLNMLINS